MFMMCIDNCPPNGRGYGMKKNSNLTRNPRQFCFWLLMGCLWGRELALTSLLGLSPRETMDVDQPLSMFPISEEWRLVETRTISKFFLRIRIPVSIFQYFWHLISRPPHSLVSLFLQYLGSNMRTLPFHRKDIKIMQKMFL